jgi:hypothetical protein
VIVVALLLFEPGKDQKMGISTGMELSEFCRVAVVDRGI